METTTEQKSTGRRDLPAPPGHSLRRVTQEKGPAEILALNYRAFVVVLAFMSSSGPLSASDEALSPQLRSMDFWLTAGETIRPGQRLRRTRANEYGASLGAASNTTALIEHRSLSGK